MDNINLTSLEKKIIEQSADLDITRKRKKVVVFTGVIAAIVFVGGSYLIRSWQFILFAALVYLLVTVFEKVMYSNAVLVYKSLIQKLKKRVEELEKKE